MASSAQMLANALEHNAEIVPKEDADAQGHKRKLEVIEQAKTDAENSAAAAENDKWVYRMAVIGLAFVIISVIGVSFVLSLINADKPIPELLAVIGGAAVGALAGLLTPIGRKSSS